MVVAVSSIFWNLETLCRLARSRPSPLWLGARADFAWPPPAGETLTEFSLPGGSLPYLALIRRRTGLEVRAETEPDRLYRHLASGGFAVAEVDSFNLPYRPAYRRVHSHRTVVVGSASQPGQVRLLDPWPPTFDGCIPRAAFEASRFSEVPLDPLREPVFAGQPVRGGWFHISADPAPLERPPERGRNLLALLAAEAASPRAAAALARFADDLTLAVNETALDENALDGPPPTPDSRLRRACLVLRAELSCRLYLAALLEALLRAADEPLLATAVHTYRDGLEAGGSLRDGLIKLMRFPRRRYRPFLARQLDRFLANERSLAELLAELPASSPAPTPRTHLARS